jgi:hypothetical protein
MLFTLINGQQQGPFSKEEMGNKLATGELSYSDLCWTEGLPNWIPVSEIFGVPPPLPTPSRTDRPADGSSSPERRETNKVPASAKVPRRSLVPRYLGAALLICGTISVLTMGLLVWDSAGLSETTNAPTDGATVVKKEPVRATPIVIAESSSLDETRFLLRLLNHLNSSWPSESLPREELAGQMVGFRRKAERARTYISAQKMDGKLLDCYDDLLGTIDYYTEYLSHLGLIDKTTQSRTEKEMGETGFNAGWGGAEAGYAISDNGGSTGQALAGAALVSLGTFLWDNHEKAQNRDEAKRVAVEEAQKGIRAQVSKYLASCKNTAQELALLNHWKDWDSGFENDEAYDSMRGRLVASGNTDGLAKLEEPLQKARADDPFLVAKIAYLRSLNSNGDAAAQVEAAKKCIESAALIPKNATFDEYRVELLNTATRVLLTAANRETGRSGWAKAFNENAAIAVQVSEACLRYTKDFTGEVREQKAWALFMSGDLIEAFNCAKSISDIRQGSAFFAYNFASLLSATGDTENSLLWLKHAVGTLGYNGIQQIKSDPDLAAVRAQKGQEIANLIAVRSIWKIKFGFMNDDIEITNTSQFELTNVVLGGNIVSGDKSWPLQLKVASLRSGQSYVWSNALSVPGSKIDESRSALDITCDQGASTSAISR